MKKLCNMSLWLTGLLLTCLLLARVGWAAEPRREPTEQELARTLVLLHEPIVMFQAKFGSLDGADRVRRVHERLDTMSADDLQTPITVVASQRLGYETREFMVNGKRVLVLVDKDLDDLDELTLDQAADRVRGRLEEVRLKYLELHSTPYLLKATGKTVLASLVFFSLIWGLQWIHRRVRKWLANRLLLQKGLIPHQWRQVAGNVEVRLLGLVTLLLVFMVTYGWLTYVLGLFPQTRAWSDRLGSSLFTLCVDMLEGIMAAMPGLVTVLLIFVMTRLFIRMLGIIFDRIERGQLRMQGLHAETVGATRRLLSVVIWLFALTVAYPYLPGANSDAFKGVSVFFGLMVTLGSAGIMNHAMSGLVLIYSRALRPGDLVQIGEVEGMVTELSALSTKLVTRQDHEVTLPNAVVVGGKVVNLTRLAGEKGVALLTKVTIGYDTPWRQVHAMLELAARRCERLNQDEAPLVRQLNLQDWYVEYELQVRMKAGLLPAVVKTELHGHIQDVFNEFGVQIMSPNFIAQPEQAVLVAKEQWYQAPAEAPKDQAPGN
ncbi:small-conductance mechanosensitive channel [Aeromonas sp. BIGb0405]|jgi:small-conductance mechanosensitive channel|uniref:mechanosensitive ion channel family protein n=1 Tax=Aeromonas sp. BIGb0405 TaxID=2940592 RepID=UPI00216A7D42|nr:mechanosensitive ion channel family protein [Aeromonas sp. BIGb0405]MCS3455650.1 small-conductance mechanosensitive channel [Aeromonas sp. BIGb0405]